MIKNVALFNRFSAAKENPSTMLAHPDSQAGILELDYVTASNSADLEEAQEQIMRAEGFIYAIAAKYNISREEAKQHVFLINKIGKYYAVYDLAGNEYSTTDEQVLSAVIYGPLPKNVLSSLQLHKTSTVHLGDDYLAHHATSRALNREVLVGTFDADLDSGTAINSFAGKTSLREFIENLREDDADTITVFTKQATRKGPSGTVELQHTPASAPDVEYSYTMQLAESTAYDGCGMLPSNIQIQQAIDFAYEERFFVVGHEVVARSPRVMEFVPTYMANPNLPHRAPYDAPDFRYLGTEKFSTCDKPTELSVDPYANAKMRRVQELVHKMQNECPTWRNYVIDMGVSTYNGQLDTPGPVLVETNSFSNAGLYGADIYAICTALYEQLSAAHLDQYPNDTHFVAPTINQVVNGASAVVF